MFDYFKNNMLCPYEDIGCKFSHVQSKEKAAQQFAEEDLENDMDVQVDDDRLNDNQCHLCRLQLLDKDDLFHHVETNHEAYFQGILEVTNNLKNLP